MEMQITQSPTGPDAPVEPQAAPVPAAEGTERPAWLPEGFDSPEALAAAYQEMTAAKPADNTEQKSPAEDVPPANTDEAVSKFVTDSGLDPVALSREIATNGDISAEAKTALAAKLEKAGLPAAMIDEYITGQKAVRDTAVRDVMSIAGGAEGWKAMAEWAGQTLSDAELAAFNKTMTSADLDTAKLMVSNLHARYKNEANVAGKRLRGGTGANTGDIFQSWEQQLAAQKDPRYRQDPAYRDEFERKIERTHKAGGYAKMRR